MCAPSRHYISSHFFSFYLSFLLLLLLLLSISWWPSFISMHDTCSHTTWLESIHFNLLPTYLDISKHKSIQMFYESKKKRKKSLDIQTWQTLNSVNNNHFYSTKGRQVQSVHHKNTRISIRSTIAISACIYLMHI